MPPTPPEPTLTPTTAKNCPWYQPLCQVTPLSKYLALVIFIAMPFVGGYLGYKQGVYDKEVSIITTVPTVSMPVATTSATNAALFVPADYTPPHVEMVTRFTKPTSTVRFAEERNVSKMMDEHTVPFDYFDKYTELSDVTYSDQEAADVSALPYLFLVASTSDYVIFSAPLFKETEGSESGLYKYDVQLKILTTMKMSSRYRPFMTGGKLSPDSTKLAVVNDPWPPVDGLSAAGLQLGYINLPEDTYIPLKTLDMKETGRFCIEEMGCGSELSWISETELQAKVTYWTKCETQHFDARDEGSKEYNWNTCSGPAVKTEIIKLAL
jgi:hypothetical protein